MRQPPMMTWMLTSLLLALTTSPAQARLIAMPQMTPTNELLAMLETWVKDHPQDAAGYYALARVHALAWAYGEKVPVLWFDHKQLPTFGEYSTIRITRDSAASEAQAQMMPQPQNPGPATPEDLQHLQASTDAYAKALTIDRDNALYEEGLAWMLQRQGLAGVAMAAEVLDLTPDEKAKYTAAITNLASADFAQREAASKLLLAAMPRSATLLKQLKTDDPEVTSRIAAVFREYRDLQALPHYRHAYALTVKKDLENQGGWGGGPDRFISLDAAEQSLRILGEHLDQAAKGEVTELKQHTQKLGDQRQNSMIDVF